MLLDAGTDKRRRVMKFKCALFACVLGVAVAGCSDHQDTRRDTTPSTTTTSPDINATNGAGAAARSGEVQTRSTGMGGTSGTGQYDDTGTNGSMNGGSMNGASGTSGSMNGGSMNGTSGTSGSVNGTS